MKVELSWEIHKLKTLENYFSFKWNYQASNIIWLEKIDHEILSVCHLKKKKEKTNQNYFLIVHNLSRA